MPPLPTPQNADRSARRTCPGLRSAASGFTLIELMVVVAIVAVLAGMAIWSSRANTDEAAMDEWAGAIRNKIKEGRSRAINSGKRYLLQVQPTRARICEVSCWSSGTYKSPWVSARNGARVKGFALSADVGIGARPHIYSSGYWYLFIYPDGTVDSKWWTTQPEGVTFYLQHDTNSKLQYRVAVLPLSANIHKFVSWD